jgi:tetraprenyl-beta-curcumene synthase
VAASFARYRGTILPRVHRELAECRRAAKLIPDPVLREQATSTLEEKASNVEATAVFAGLAPRRTRPAVIRASTALQVAVDYLDTLGEQPGPDPLGDGLLLHGALAAALDPSAAMRDWYAHHPQREDGGYLDRLVTTCRQAAVSLPSAATILPLAHRAIVRCGEGQSHTHATADGSARELRQWASELPAPSGFEWWEVAAGASSSVAAHALLALAAEIGATRAQGELVEAAYFPSIGALTVLLDDLVDREADLAAGEHSYLRHYPSDAVATDRLLEIARLADRSVSSLPRSGRHRAILSGVLAFYLSSPGAAAPGARTIRDRMLSSSGPAVKALAGALRRKRPGPAGTGPGL